MKLVLNADVSALGERGDVVEVSDGYARNYLLPNKLASKATPASIAAAEQAAATRGAAERKLRQDAEDLASQLGGTRVVLAAQAGDEGRLYGSVGVADVVEGIRKFTGIQIERKHVELAEPIKAIGLHEITVRFHPEVAVPVTIDVIPA
ncbi:MAG TPA: 50S ribosomal protein L9 [Acidimicrobiia bacterium]|nr:50S ribosomal protein L9 [Acidimicrobiia bacterium]